MRGYKETSAILRGLSVSLQAIDPDYAQLCDDAADVIEELDVIVEGYRSRMRLGSQWISVEERLPEQGERVLVSNGGFICESYLSQSGKWQRGGVDMFFMTPTHWMPLPEPPTKGVE